MRDQGTVGENLDVAQDHVSPGVVRGERQRLVAAASEAARRSARSLLNICVPTTEFDESAAEPAGRRGGGWPRSPTSPIPFYEVWLGANDGTMALALVRSPTSPISF